MRNIIFLFLLGISIQCFSQISMSSEEANSFKEKVIELDKNTTSIVSDFTQYKHLSFLNNDIKTEGKLIFKTPFSIKWEYTSPYQYSAIFKNDKLYINDGGDKSNIDIGSNKMFKNLNQLIINSVKGNMFDEEAFTIKYFKIEKDYLVKFIPKDEQMRDFLASFELYFNHKTSDVTKVKMIEPSEDYTEIIFHNKTRNTTVVDEEFSN